jgi:pimeloyl-ACP methyl ester carboxylesterase
MIVAETGMPLSIDCYGEESSPRKILLVPGGYQTRDCWRLVGAPLANAGCYVVAMDLPYCGLSGPYEVPPDALPEGFWARALRAVVEQRGMAPFTLVCWSFSGFLATDYLLSYAPDARVNALVLVSTVLMGGEEAQALAETMQRNPWLADLLSTDSHTRAGAVPPFVAALTAQPEPDREHYLKTVTTLSAVLRAGGQTLTGHLQGNVRKVLRQLDIPTLFVYGTADPLLPPGYVRGYAELLIHPRVVECPCGHSPHLEVPELFAEEVLKFVLSL